MKKVSIAAEKATKNFSHQKLLIDRGVLQAAVTPQ